MSRMISIDAGAGVLAIRSAGWDSVPMMVTEQGRTEDNGTVRWVAIDSRFAHGYLKALAAENKAQREMS